MTDQQDRPLDDWLPRLGQALTDVPVRSVASPAEPDPPASLPAWPLTLSGLGLCLAVLALTPSETVRATAPQPPMPVPPQVQGWQSFGQPSASWPPNVPRSGYRGLAPPQPSPALPLEPPPEIVLAPLHLLPPQEHTEPAPQSVTFSEPIAPPFVPQRPVWGEIAFATAPPAFHAVPAEKMSLDRPASGSDQLSTKPSALRSDAQPRQRAAPPRPERAVSRPKPKPLEDQPEGPVWAEKVFGPRRSS